MTVGGRSHRWWRREWKPLRKKARKCKEARKELHEQIRKAKREMWTQWVEAGKAVWDLVRMAKSPFNLKEMCTQIEDNEGRIHRSPDDRAGAFVKYNIISKGVEEVGKKGYRGEQRAKRGTGH